MITIHVMVMMMTDDDDDDDGCHVVMVTSIFMIRPVVVMIRPAWWSR